MSKKKEDLESLSATTPEETPLQVLVLDRVPQRYPIVRLAVDWAYALHKKQEYMHLKTTELLDMALQDVISGKVDRAAIDKEIEAVKKRALEEQAEETAALKLKLKEKDTGDEDDASLKEAKKKKAA